MIRRTIATSLCAVALLMTTGCGVFERWFGSSADPSALVSWARSNAVSVGPPPAPDQGPDKTTVRATSDNGYEFRDEKFSLVLYFIPLEKLDPSYEATLRKLAFPGGTATVQTSGGSPVKLAESEIDKVYLNVFVARNASLCDNFKTRCDAALGTSIVATLKNAPMFKRGGRSLNFDPIREIDNDKLIAGHVGDAQSICGFDPNRDRVPAHIANGCDTVRLVTFAIDNGFTMAAGQGLVAMTPEAVKTTITEFLAEPIYKDGVLKARLMENR